MSGVKQNAKKMSLVKQNVMKLEVFKNFSEEKKGWGRGRRERIEKGREDRDGEKRDKRELS